MLGDSERPYHATEGPVSDAYPLYTLSDAAALVREHANPAWLTIEKRGEDLDVAVPKNLSVDLVPFRRDNTTTDPELRYASNTAMYC